METNKIFQAQCRMARAGLGMTMEELSRKAKVHKNTILRIESGKPAHNATIEVLRRVLEDLGVKFDREDGCAGVRLPIA